MPNNIFSKNSIIWVFQRNFMFFFEDCNVPKNCEILHFVHRSEPQSQMEVFFYFFSFYYRLGTVSCQITFFKKLNNLSFSTKFYVFFEDCNVPKNCEILHFVNHGSEAQSQMVFQVEDSSIFSLFLTCLLFRNSIMPNNIFSKNSIIWVFQRNFMFFFWRLQCTKKLRNSPLCPPEWSSITNGSFLRFFLFLLPFRNSIMPNNSFQKTQ